MLSRVDVIDIRERWMSGTVLPQHLIRQYGVDPKTIYEVLDNVSWHDPGYVPPKRRMARKLTPAQVAEARSLWVPGTRRTRGDGSILSLSKQFGVAYSSMWNALHQD